MRHSVSMVSSVLYPFLIYIHMFHVSLCLLYITRDTLSFHIHISLWLPVHELTRYSVLALEWRHNERDGVSNHQHHHCLLNRLFRRRSKKTSKFSVTSLCAGNSPVTSQHKGPVTRKMFPFDDVIMNIVIYNPSHDNTHTTPHLQYTLRWRHNDHAGVSNHQPPGCWLNRLFRRKSKKTSKLRVTGLCAGNSPGTGEFSAQMASYAENVSIWWRRHDSPISQRFYPSGEQLEHRKLAHGL